MTDHYDDTSQPMEKYLDDLANEKPRPFSYEELKRFTFEFEKHVGHGGFGDVYQGKLFNGVKIAVKVLKENTKDVMRKQFMAEVSTMGRTFHPNLVKLYGYCFNANTKALVYEYVEHGSLDKILFKNDPEVEWEKLYGIAIEIAYGLSYLHEHCRPQIIHYDIKPDNVLIDSNFSPKIIDFGMARHSNQAEQSSYRGTSGYAAPEVGKGRHVTYKSDIYSFGMMMFEFLRRKRNSQGPGWFPGEVGERVENDDLNEIILVCGIKESDKENAERLCLLALWCTQQNHLRRPDMSSVVKMLQGEIPLRKPPNPFPFYDSSPQSSMFDARPLPKFSPAFSHGLPESSLTHKESGSSSVSRPASKNRSERESDETDLFDTRPEQNTSVQTEQKEVRFQVSDSSKPGNEGEPRSSKANASARRELSEQLKKVSVSAKSRSSPEQNTSVQTEQKEVRFEVSDSFDSSKPGNEGEPRSSKANASARRELSEQLKKVSISAKSRSTESLLKSLEKQCPPGGENSVIVYTTTGGNREPFKDSNKIRSMLQSHHIQMFERDIYKDALFREQLKGLMGYIKVPLMFVKGRLVGGADEVMVMEENGDLGILFDGIPKLQEQAKTKPIPREPRSSKANASIQREPSKQLKKASISPKPRSSESLLESLEKRCPPGGGNSVILYTTTGGDREPFKDSNKIRSMLQSHYIQMFERDIFKDALFREQLKGLMGYIKVPLMFVKGRLVGGADEVMVMEENGDLGILFDGIPKLQEQVKTKAIPREPRSSKANASIQRAPSEQLKKVSISPKPRSSESLLESLEKRCPPGGRNSVIVYTTTGGNREPFKDSNKVRSMLQSHYIQMFERDIFNDALYREQLKELMGYIKVPLLFVKGRLVGGADEVSEMEENGNLDILFDGIPKLQKQAKTKPMEKAPRSSGAVNTPIQWIPKMYQEEEEEEEESDDELGLTLFH